MSIVFFMSIFSVFLSVVFFSLFFFLSSRFIKDREKSSPFECGFDPKNSSRIPFSMRFFLLAVIFLVFDLEIVLLVPIIMFLSNLCSFGGLFSGYIFVMILFLGTLYEWWEGSFNWIY